MFSQLQARNQEMKTKYILVSQRHQGADPHGGWERGCVSRAAQGTQGQSPVLTLGLPQVPLGPL